MENDNKREKCKDIVKYRGGVGWEKRITKERYKEIYRIYVSSNLSEQEIADSLGVSLKTVNRAVRWCIERSEEGLKSQKEWLIVMLEKVRDLKQRLMMEIERIKDSKEMAGVRAKYYSELRKNTELEARLLGLLSSDGATYIADKMIVVHNVRDKDKEKVIEVEVKK